MVETNELPLCQTVYGLPLSLLSTEVNSQIRKPYVLKITKELKKFTAVDQIRFTLFFQYEHTLPNFKIASASLSVLDFNMPCSIL